MFTVTRLDAWNEEFEKKMNEQVFGDMKFEDALNILEGELGGDEETPLTLDKMMTAIGAAYGCLFAQFFMTEFVDDDIRYVDLDSVEDGGELVMEALKAMLKGLTSNHITYAMQ